MQNIRSRAQEMGRDVEKNEVIDKFSNMYRYCLLYTSDAADD